MGSLDGLTATDRQVDGVPAAADDPGDPLQREIGRIEQPGGSRAVTVARRHRIAVIGTEVESAAVCRIGTYRRGRNFPGSGGKKRRSLDMSPADVGSIRRVRVRRQVGSICSCQNVRVVTGVHGEWSNELRTLYRTTRVQPAGIQNEPVTDTCPCRP